jgi:hypothetical protein
MKKIQILLFSVILVTGINSCKKESSGTGSNSSPGNKITITNLQTSDDSVVVTWTKLVNSRFSYYLILRRNYKSTDTTDYSYSDVIDQINDVNTVKFVDHSIPVTSYLEYQVLAVLQESEFYNYNYIYSNIMSYKRSGLTTFYLNPTDVIPDIANHRFYVIEGDSGKVSMVDYSSRSIVKSIMTNATIGFSDIGTYNNIKELYVPRNDGWVFIYNAETLDKIDQISAGTNCGSVLYNNGKLFIFGSSEDYYTSLFVIDRATKSVLSTINDIDYMRPELVPGSNTKIFGITTYGGIYYFKFDANGQNITENENSTEYSTDYHSFEIFPDGQHFITSDNGSIFDTNLNFVVQLPYGNYQYSGFAFNQTASNILASCGNYKYIVAYSNPGYTELQTYNTLGYPAFIFNDNNTIISLSSTTSYSYDGYGNNYIIESIPLTKKTTINKFQPVQSHQSRHSL